LIIKSKYKDLNNKDCISDTMKKERISLIAFSLAGILAGYISFVSETQTMAVVSMMAGLIVISQVLKYFIKKEEMKWYMTNGGWVYVFVWFVAWTILYNL